MQIWERYAPFYHNYLTVCIIKMLGSFLTCAVLFCNLFSQASVCPEFFKLMNEVENEDLVFTLETIVDKFGEEMAPYAFGLCQNLVMLYFTCFDTLCSIVGRCT